MKPRTVLVVGITVIIGLIASVVLFFVAVLNSGIERRHETYRAWKRINPQYELTFDEWVGLANEGALPGQQRLHLE